MAIRNMLTGLALTAAATIGLYAFGVGASAASLLLIGSLTLGSLLLFSNNRHHHHQRHVRFTTSDPSHGSLPSQTIRVQRRAAPAPTVHVPNPPVIVRTRTNRVPSAPSRATRTTTFRPSAVVPPRTNPRTTTVHTHVGGPILHQAPSHRNVASTRAHTRTFRPNQPRGILDSFFSPRSSSSRGTGVSTTSSRVGHSSSRSTNRSTQGASHTRTFIPSASNRSTISSSNHLSRGVTHTRTFRPRSG